MRYFKDSADGFYSAADDVQPLDVWVEITEAEWLAANPQQQSDPKYAIRAQIDQLLYIAGVSQDWHLDAMMAGMVALAATQGISEPDLYSVNPGYKQVKDVSEQIKALRAQL